MIGDDPATVLERLMDKKNLKTKRVAGVDLGSDCFLYAPDPANTAGWLFAVLVRGDEPKTRNLIATHFHNFDARTVGLSESLRQELWDMLRGCAVTHGLHAERRVFAAKNTEPTKAAEPAPTVQPAVKEKPLKPDRHTEELFAKSDYLATAFLKSLGID